jgi:hypothetical protein
MIQPQRELQLSESLRYTISKSQFKSKFQSLLENNSIDNRTDLENDCRFRNSTLEIPQNRLFGKQENEQSKRASLNFRELNTIPNEKSFVNEFFKRTSGIKPAPPQRTSSLRSKMNDFDVSSLNESELKYFKNDTYLMNDDEASKFEFCYRSIGTSVYTCKCSANLYSANAKDLTLLLDWNYQFTGVPILVFNTGVNPKRRKSLSLIIADKLTAFSLWKIDYITFENDFQQPKSGHITFKYNNIGLINQNFNKKDKKIATQVNESHKFFYLKFSNDHECDMFYDNLNKIRLNPNNKDLFDSKYMQNYNYHKKSKKNVMNIIVRRITKSHISNPCFFRHINSVPNLLSLQSQASLFELDETSITSSINTLVATTTTTNSDDNTSSNRVMFCFDNEFQ